ncbi:Vms1/Ankzf1 family peptidyl-tRNA hydrolase [Luteipulveratus sp. YIM 133132]|uniref:baeRF2 domain-containing protein n=1 Tax=Luteipulveratus flavus TaxID=3031728 RepID=UPI0023AF9A7C|nr:Vms1/Ankzf1 family peptidyl-tRNA hydrolase [Luteipulveratus sp. YIM 133132]MDE9365724.1 Vms1/Ankzf1 family peptidyl-tRNA hydrolase [Luteipulveratus sp. YIM 133132]
MRLDRWHDLDLTDRQVATVALDVSRQGPEGNHEIELRWRAARTELLESGAPKGLVDLLEPVAVRRDRRAGENGRFLIGSVGSDGDARVDLDVSLPEAPDRERIVWADVPDLLPLLRCGQKYPTYVTVEADRAGADITAYSSFDETPARTTVDGDHDVLHKVPGGASSQQRLQRRAVDSWERNADEVAAELDDLVRRVRPTAVLVAGDDRALGALRGSVSDLVRGRSRLLSSGGRAAGTSEEAFAEDVRRHLDAVIDADIEACMDRFREQDGRQERAVQGRSAVLDSLGRGQVDTLLLVDPPVNARTSAEAAALALRTDAQVCLLPDGDELADGIAAVLRWSDSETQHDSAPSMPGHGERPGWAGREGKTSDFANEP